MLTYLYVAVGGALGSMGRYWMSGTVDARLDGRFPWGTVAVNVLGSFVIGLLAGVESLASEARLLLVVGLCGGFTTFSAFSVQTVDLLRDGMLARAGANVAVSVLACTLATWLGLTLIDRTSLG